MPRFRVGEEVRAADLNLLVREVERCENVLAGAAGPRARVGGLTGMEFFSLAGDVAMDEVETLGVNGDAEPNPATGRVANSDKVEVVDAGDANCEFLYESGACHPGELGQYNWTVRRPARWFYGGVPEDCGAYDEETGWGDALVRGVRRRNEDGEMVCTCMFPSAPEGMYFMRSMDTRSESWGVPQQVVVVPGADGWQDVLIRVVQEVHYVPAELNYTRKMWTWGLEAQMDEFGRVRFRSRCVEGNMQPGY